MQESSVVSRQSTSNDRNEAALVRFIHSFIHIGLLTKVNVKISIKHKLAFPVPGGPQRIKLGRFPSLAMACRRTKVSSLPTTSSRA